MRGYSLDLVGDLVDVDAAVAGHLREVAVSTLERKDNKITTTMTGVNR